MKVFCEVYRNGRHGDTYLYVNKVDGLNRVPAPLLEQFGKPERALSFLLTEDKSLASADAKTVMDSISEKGFYLQLPQNKDDDYMQAVNQHNSKLSG